MSKLYFSISLVVIYFVTLETALAKKSSYRMHLFDRCPISGAKPDSISIRIANLPKVASHSETGKSDTSAKADSHSATEKSLLVPIATSGLVGEVAVKATEFLIDTIFTKITDSKNIKDGKKMFAESFRRAGQGYFYLDASGQYHAPLLHKCIVVARGFYDGLADGETPIRDGFWRSKAGQTVLGKQYLNLKQRPNFYAEFLPELSVDNSAFKLTPKVVIYPKHIHASARKLRRKDAVSVSLELRSASSKTMFVGGILFPKSSIGNLGAKTHSILENSEYKPLFEENDLIAIAAPSKSTIAKIGATRASWMFLTDFATKHEAALADQITAKERTQHSKAALETKNLLFARIIFATSQRLKMRYERDLGAARENGANPNQQEINRLLQDIEVAKALVKLYTTKIAKNGDESAQKSLREQIGIVQNIDQEIERLKKDHLIEQRTLGKKEVFLQSYSALEEAITVINENAANSTVRNADGEKIKVGLHEPFNFYGVVVESAKLSKFSKLVRDFISKNKDDLQSKIVNAIFDGDDLEKKIEKATATAELSLLELQLTDAQLSLAEAESDGLSEADIRKKQIEVRKLEGLISVARLKAS